MLGVAGALAALMLTADVDAFGAARVTGGSDTSSPLVIRPSGDPQTSQRDLYQENTVAFVQRMPKTKTVNRIWLGDLGLADSCTNGTSVQLFVREHPTGDINTSTQITYSHAGGRDLKSPIPATPGKVSWSIPTTTFEEGKGYSFQIFYPTDCRYVKQVTWAHEEAVNPGPARCTDGPRVDTNGGYPAQQRMWHAAGSADASAPCASNTPSNPAFFDPSMPTGWLVTRTG